MDNLDARDKSNSFELLPTERVGVQERPEVFGTGDTKRVYEIQYKDFSIGVNCGDISQVPTEAVMCPTTPWLEIGGGAIENVLARAAGETLFESYAEDLMNIVGKVLTTDGAERVKAAAKLQNLLKEKGRMRVEATPEEVANDIASSCEISKFEDGTEHPALFYGAAIPAPSGRLAEVGIKLIVLTNVTPDGSKEGQSGGMTRQHMESFTYNSCKAAHLVGINSITIPAVGTGFAATFGFGLSREDSMCGFFAGAKKFADEFKGKTQLKQIDYNVYIRPSEESAKQIAKATADYGIKRLLQN